MPKGRHLLPHLAQRANQPLWKANYIVLKHRIDPIERVGRTRLYDDAAAARILALLNGEEA
jgi:hypothetical protein